METAGLLTRVRDERDERRVLVSLRGLLERVLDQLEPGRSSGGAVPR